MARNVFKDPRGKSVRIYADIYTSAAWKYLSKASQALYGDLRTTLGPANNGDISATLGTLESRGWNSSATLSNALLQLQALGFIAMTRRGGVANGKKECCLYRFTDEDMYDFPKRGIKAIKATKDYLKLTTAEACKAAIEDFTIRRKMNQAETQSGRNFTVQKLKRDRSETEAVKPFYRSETEAEAPSTVQKLKRQKQSSKPLKPLVSEALRHVSPAVFKNASTASETEHLYMLAIPGAESGAVAVPSEAFTDIETGAALEDSPTTGNIAEEVVASWRDRGKREATETAPRAAKASVVASSRSRESADSNDLISRCRDDAPSEYWDANLGEFREVPKLKRRATRLVDIGG